MDRAAPGWNVDRLDTQISLTEETMPNTIADDIAAINADSTQLATDQGVVVAAQTALSNAQAVVDADNTTITVADTTLSTALQTAGVPVFVANADGSVSVYAYSASPPGFTITVVQPAGGLPG